MWRVAPPLPAAFSDDLRFSARHTVSQVSAMTAFGDRWIEQLLAHYNAEGPDALGDLRRRNGASATILTSDLFDKLRLREPLRWRVLVEPHSCELDG